jgi:hypothetical protein
LLSSGGDARIVLDASSGVNRYHSSPYPRQIVAYASSTANDISPVAFRHVCERLGHDLPPYRQRLDDLRGRIRDVYRLSSEADIVFAASGTDLEYVALAAVAGRGEGGTHNILLGADEVGSGCIHSAHGRYFADQTARGVPTEPAKSVPGLGAVTMVDVAVRDADGTARDSAHICRLVEHEISRAAKQGRHALVHVVHGSKTGLILPATDDLAWLVEKWAGQASFVVDACQARLTGKAARAYLDLGCILFITGSKFMGGPPFSGFAIVPEGFKTQAGTLPEGMKSIFRHGEWPQDWPGASELPEEENGGLALRLEASIFELERYSALPLAERTAIILAFQKAVNDNLVEPLGLRRVLPHHPEQLLSGYAHPTAMLTLVTLDVSMVPGVETFADAQTLHRSLVARGIRLGQPVKCLVNADGEWAGTLRIGLSMPQVVELSAAGPEDAARKLAGDMQAIAAAMNLKVTA